MKSADGVRFLMTKQQQHWPRTTQVFTSEWVTAKNRSELPEFG
jgi:hypothetical protein